ncbi:6897_t:CDS:2, partial [Scutellospora calospora]
GKFVVFTVVNYLDPFFDLRRNYPGVTDSYLLGDAFNAATDDTMAE